MTIKILDCSIRDGGYINNWNFSKEIVREVYRALSKSGVDFIELGFRSSVKYFDNKKYGLWRYCTEENLLDVTNNIHGAKISIMVDFGKVDITDLVEKTNSAIDMVRVAVHRNNIFRAIDFIEKIKSKGYLTSLQCMGISCYTDQEKKDLLKALKDTEIDVVYLADSYGSIFPFQIKELFLLFLELGNFKVGFHPHNNIQMAFANTLEVIRLEVDFVDTTIYGIGRGAGNLPTEILLSYLLMQDNDKYNVIPVLNCIEKYFLDLIKEMPWGYQLPYMISGIFNSHSNYSKELLRRQEYSMEDIWKALECIKENNPVGFDKKLVEELIKKGFIGSSPNKKYSIDQNETKEDEFILSHRPHYINRHPQRDFLVLANGPTLKKHKSKIDRFIEKYNPVILGANFLNHLYEPEYHAFNNKKRFTSYVDTVSKKSKLLIGNNIPKEMIREYVDRDYEYLTFQDILDADFNIQDGIIMANCRTISVLLIAVSVVMGANRVFVAGMDGYLNKETINNKLFYEEKFDLKDHELNVERHRWNEKFLYQIDEFITDKTGEGVHIITPTTHSAFYKSISNYI